MNESGWNLLGIKPRSSLVISLHCHHNAKDILLTASCYLLRLLLLCRCCCCLRFFQLFCCGWKCISEFVMHFTDVMDVAYSCMLRFVASSSVSIRRIDILLHGKWSVKDMSLLQSNNYKGFIIKQQQQKQKNKQIKNK